jgi:hypothetical protein
VEEGILMAGAWGISVKATGRLLLGMSPSSGEMPVTVTSETWSHNGGGERKGREQSRGGNKTKRRDSRN